ncbi:hypothetical protein EYR38_007443 [Pleurotus pulmonarius]|nr:hypothetical protein EYR38_007443 [Pleurotus pulmonarius]
MSYLKQDSYLELPQRRTRSKQLPTELIDRVISLLEEYTDDERARYRGRRLARVAANALRARNTAKPYWVCPHIQLPNLDSLFCEYTWNHYPAPCIPATVSELAVKVSANSAPPRFSPANRLHSLTIDICPTRRTLHLDGALKHLDLTLEVNASEIASDRIVYPVYRTRAEVAIVKEVWGPVLETGEVVVDLTFELTTSIRELVVMKYRL